MERLRGGWDDVGRPLDFLPSDDAPTQLPELERRLTLDFTSTSSAGDGVSSTLFFNSLFESPTP